MLRVVALALLLLLALVGVMVWRTLQRIPDTIVYMVRDQGTTFTLDGVYRRTRSTGVEATVRAALGALAAGPTEEEAARGLHSAVPSDLEVHGVRFAEGLLSVDLGATFTHGGGTASMLGRLHQVLYTLAQPSGVERVALFIEGEPLTVLGGEGVMVAHPWSRPGPGVPSW